MARVNGTLCPALGCWSFMMFNNCLGDILGQETLESTIGPKVEAYVANLIDLNERRIMSLEKEVDVLEQKPLIFRNNWRQHSTKLKLETWRYSD